MTDVPYIPGPTSAAPRTAVTAALVPPQRHVPEPTPAVPIVGETVDLAHELAALRKLHTTNMAISGVTFVLALLAVVFSGFVAYELWTFLGALHRAFG